MKDTQIQDIENKILDSIKKVAKDKSVIIGLSGGIDSSIVCALAVKALGKERVKVLTVKNSRYSAEGLAMARELAKGYGLEIHEVNSEILSKQAIGALGIDPENVLESSTLDARICDIMIKTVASKENRIYLGTINGTERLTGWYPKGDLVGDFCPIGGLLKEQERELANHMGLGYFNETISSDAAKVCSGCGELPEFKGIPYEVLDKILLIYEISRGDELAGSLRGSGIKKDVYSKIINRVMFADHKNDVFPDYCKINFPGGVKR